MAYLWLAQKCCDVDAAAKGRSHQHFIAQKAGVAPALRSQEDTVDEQPDLIEQLAKALLAPNDPTSCSACLDHLEEYVTAQLNGEPYRTIAPEVTRHLDSCVACSESYALLYDTLLAGESVPQPQHIPVPDLSFLVANASGPISPAELRAQRKQRFQHALSAAIEAGAQRLRVRLSQALLDLLAAQPTATPSLAFRNDEQPPLYQMTVQNPSPTVSELQFAAYASPNQELDCMVRVLLALPDRAWPDLEGIPVRLLLPEGQRQANTDAWGEATFANIPRAVLPELQIEVEA
jgi:hypothetical protein